MYAIVERGTAFSYHYIQLLPRDPTVNAGISIMPHCKSYNLSRYGIIPRYRASIPIRPTRVPQPPSYPIHRFLNICIAGYNHYHRIHPPQSLHLHSHCHLLHVYGARFPNAAMDMIDPYLHFSVANRLLKNLPENLCMKWMTFPLLSFC